jgi:hypothetical protein
MNKSKVYFTREITPSSLVEMYKAVGKELTGKVSTKPGFVDKEYDLIEI